MHLLILILILVAGCDVVSPPAGEPRVAERDVPTLVDEEFRYSARRVADARGTLYLLHGYGDNDENFLRFATQMQLPWTIVSIRAPEKVQEKRWAWFSRDPARHDEARAAELTRRLARFIDEPPEGLGQARPRVVLGFSQGAMMAVRLAASELDVDGFVMLSGRWPDGLQTDASVRKTRYFVAHGTDDRVFPVERGRELSERLSTSGDVTFKEYDAAHSVPPKARDDLLLWLQQF